MLEFREQKKVINIYREKTYLGKIYLSINYEKYYFDPSGIAISENQLTQILEKIRKMNDELISDK